MTISSLNNSRHAFPVTFDEPRGTVTDHGSRVTVTRVTSHESRFTSHETHSGLMFASFTTFVHFAISLRTIAVNASGVVGEGSAPNST